MKIHALRLKPGQDIRKELETYVADQEIEAASIISAVGSVLDGFLRYSDKNELTKIPGPLEVVSLSGTLSMHGMHLHASFSDENGKTLGGHLGEGNIVHTTLEVVLAEYPELIFRRPFDESTGYKELVVERK